MEKIAEHRRWGVAGWRQLMAANEAAWHDGHLGPGVARMCCRCRSLLLACCPRACALLACRRQEAAARQRALAVQHAQHMPALKQAAAAARPASSAGTLRTLAGRPVFPASPTLAAAVAGATSSLGSLPAISTLQAGLEAGAPFTPGTAAARSGAPALAGGRATWMDRQRSEAAAHVEEVYCRIQASTGGWGRRGGAPGPRPWAGLRGGPAPGSCLG